jgi:hypothetical protein
MAIGWFGEDVADAVGGALKDAWDVFDDLPVLEQLGDGVKAVVTGPLRDFAKDSIGQTVLRAMATAVSGGVGLALMGAGPFQVFAMASAHALPGMARGDSFEEALLTENLWRLEKTAELLGPDVASQLPDQWRDAIDELKARAAAALPDLALPEAVSELAARAGVDPETYARRLAAEMGIREDMAVQALEMVGRINLMDQGSYDLATGRRLLTPQEAAREAFARSIKTTVRADARPESWALMRSTPTIANRAVATTTTGRSLGLELLRAHVAVPVRPNVERAARPADEPPPPPPGVSGVAALVVAAAVVGGAIVVARRR